MILEALNDLYDRLAADPAYEIARPGFSPQKISFRIVIKPDGTLVAFEDARTRDRRGQLVPSRIEVPAHEKRTSGIKPQFICDKVEYLLGWSAEASKQASASRCFDEFKKVHLGFEDQINCPSFSSICRFLEKWDPAIFHLHYQQEIEILEKIAGNFGVWSIQGEKRDIHDGDTIKNWWFAHQLSLQSSATRQCLVSGKKSAICRIHPDVKGFKSSIALVGIQEKTSYESYGLSKTENCPISNESAFRYATALNALTDGPKRQTHRCIVAETTVLFWSEQHTILEDIFVDIFQNTAPTQSQDSAKLDQISRLFKAIKTGENYKPFGELDTAFYILGIEQPNPGRFCIRFFHQSSVGDILSKLHDHHKCMEIVQQFGEDSSARPDPEIPAIWQILDQVPPQKNNKPDRAKIPPLLGGALARSIIEGTPYPEALFSAVIRRIHADRTVNYLRAATLKAVLTRNHNQTIPVMLDPTNTTSAYLLGRLFATLEKIQKEGHFAQTGRDLKETIKERFFSSACATPASVFPRLLTLSVHHQRHLNPGRKVQFDQLLGEIQWNLSGTKKTHTLIEQGQFILGYYHQQKDFFTKKETAETTQP